MAGRPSLRIGSHGKISRKRLGDGVWLARCRYRDSDGVTRIVERRGPADDFDKHGKLAEDALIEALQARRAPADEEISLDTKISVLVDQHLDRLAEDGRSGATLDTYKIAARNLAKFLGGVRVGEATPTRIDAALRSVRTAHGATGARQARTILRGGLDLAVMAGVLGTNPVRDVAPIKSKQPPNGAKALTGEQLRSVLAGLGNPRRLCDADEDRLRTGPHRTGDRRAIPGALRCLRSQRLRNDGDDVAGAGGPAGRQGACGGANRGAIGGSTDADGAGIRCRRSGRRASNG